MRVTGIHPLHMKKFQILQILKLLYIPLLDMEMNAAGDDFKKIQELADQRDILEQSIEEKMERWMFLEDKKQEIENAKGK